MFIRNDVVFNNILSKDLILLVGGKSIKPETEEEIEAFGEVKIDFVGKIRKTLTIPEAPHQLTVSLSLAGKALQALTVAVALTVLLLLYLRVTGQLTFFWSTFGFAAVIITAAANFWCMRNNRDLKVKSGK